jgi:tRNA nucleotidyltransferase/poly(A) polymerase
MLRRLAEITGQELFIVGGTVRDLLRGYPPRDVDLCCEGASEKFEEVIRTRWKEVLPEGPGVAHVRRSATTDLLKVRLWGEIASGCSSFDIAPAEKLYREINPHFTRAELSPIEWNLVQRDFTVNAMALGVGPQQPGRLYDLFLGGSDLQAGCLRGLHDKLYLLDPVVSIRGPAAEARLEFRLSKVDEQLIQEAFAAKVFDSFNRPALYRYVKAALGDLSAARIAQRILTLGGEGQVFPMSVTRESVALLSSTLTKEFASAFPGFGSEGLAPYSLAILAGGDVAAWKKFYGIRPEEEHSLQQVRNLLIQRGLVHA